MNLKQSMSVRRKTRRQTHRPRAGRRCGQWGDRAGAGGWHEDSEGVRNAKELAKIRRSAGRADPGGTVEPGKRLREAGAALRPGAMGGSRPGTGDAAAPKRVRRGDRRSLGRSEKRQAAAILNVHLPSLAGRRRRLRSWGRRLISASVVAVLILLAVGVARLWLRHGLVHSEHFQLTELEVSGDGWRDAAWVRATLGLGAQTPLLDLDLAEIERRLEADPGVIRARLQRELPGRLRVDLEERHPLAWLEAPALGLRPLSATGGLLLDAAGHAWRPQQLRPEWVDLPVVVSARLERLPEDGRLDDRALGQSLELIRLLQAEPGLDPALHPQRVRLIDEPGGRPAFRVEVTTLDRQQLLFSLDPLLSGSLAGQCRLLAEVAAELAERGETIERLNLCQRRELAVVLRGRAGSRVQQRTGAGGPSLQEALDLAALEAVDGQEDSEQAYAGARVSREPVAGQALDESLAAANGVPAADRTDAAAVVEAGLAAAPAASGAEPVPTAPPPFSPMAAAEPALARSPQTVAAGQRFQEDLRSILTLSAAH